MGCGQLNYAIVLFCLGIPAIFLRTVLADELSVTYNVGRTYVYTYWANVTISDTEGHGTKQAVGLKLHCSVEITPLWRKQRDMLLKLQIFSSSLSGVRNKNRLAFAKDLETSPVYFLWSSLKVPFLFHNKLEDHAVINIKKGIVSLFHLTTKITNQTEKSASGMCTADYTVGAEKIHKSLRDCRNQKTTEGYFNTNQALGLSTTSRTNVDYVIEHGIISSATALQVISTHLPISAAMDTYVSSRQDIVFDQSIQGDFFHTDGDNVEEILANINDHSYPFTTSELLTTTEERNCSSDFKIKRKDLRDNWYLLNDENITSVEGATVFLDMVKKCRHMDKDSVLGLLQHKKHESILPVLVDIITATQTDASHKAMLQYFDFSNLTQLELAKRYLRAVSFSTHPSETLLKGLLKLYRNDSVLDELREIIALALGAVTHTYSKMVSSSDKNIESQLLEDICDTFEEMIEACEDEICKMSHVRGLSNAGLPSLIPLLLKYAETANTTWLGETAIKAFRKITKHFIDEKVLNVMDRIFYQEIRGYDTAIRARALDYILSDNNLTVERLRRIFLESLDPWETGFAASIQARILNVAQSNKHIKEMLTEILKDESLRNYDILAPKGRSVAVTEVLSETSDIVIDYNIYTEQSRFGLMKRGGMDVILRSSKQTLPIYNFGMFSAGMENVISSTEKLEDHTEEEVPSAGMNLHLLDVALPPVQFFEGTAGLMAAVWSAPNDLTSALHVNIMLQDYREVMHLHNGLVLGVEAHGVLVLDISGYMKVSLWNRNTKTLLRNSGALVMRGSTEILDEVTSCGFHYNMSGASHIDFRSYVDFSDKINMCFQMSSPVTNISESLGSYEGVDGSDNVWTRRKQTVPGVCYPLLKQNTDTCRHMQTSQEEN